MFIFTPPPPDVSSAESASHRTAMSKFRAWYKAAIANPVMFARLAPAANPLNLFNSTGLVEAFHAILQEIGNRLVVCACLE